MGCIPWLSGPHSPLGHSTQAVPESSPEFSYINVFATIYKRFFAAVGLRRGPGLFGDAR